MINIMYIFYVHKIILESTIRAKRNFFKFLDNYIVFYVY